MATDTGLDAEVIQSQLKGKTVQFGIPSLNEGELILRTLESLDAGAQHCGLGRPRVILVDDSETQETIRAAQDWALRSGANLTVNHSDVRRSIKGALNVMYANAQADILVVLAADARAPIRSLAHLLLDLTAPPQPEVAFGVAAPDPEFGGVRRSPSRWQMKVVSRVASMLPKEAVRAEGTFYGMWRTFYAYYRYPLGKGSIYEDAELARHLSESRIPVRISSSALAYKIPASGLKDFMIQTHRWFAAQSVPHRRTKTELAAALAEAVLDPFGAMAYLYARTWSAVQFRRSKLRFGEKWPVADSTKRLS